MGVIADLARPRHQTVCFSPTKLHSSSPPSKIKISLICIVWDDVYGFDFSCIKDIALREPLVDCVELKAVATQPCAIKHIDIRTATKDDLTFKVPFELRATRNDCESR